MLYLLRSYGSEGKEIYKVGYAEDINRRLLQYKSHNPYVELLSSREGESRRRKAVPQIFSLLLFL